MKAQPIQDGDYAVYLSMGAVHGANKLGDIKWADGGIEVATEKGILVGMEYRYNGFEALIEDDQYEYGSKSFHPHYFTLSMKIGYKF